MKVLALDTSTEKIVVAVSNGESTVFSSRVGVEKHATTLAPFLRNVLDHLGIDLKDVDILGLGVGPGNLTGLRIGIATVIGIASVSGAKIVRLNSLELISRNVPFVRKAVVRRARKGYVYGQIFPDDGEPRVYEISEFENRLKGDRVVLLGDGADLFEGEIAPKVLWNPFPEVLFEMTLERSETAVELTEVTPLYVQKSIAEINLERRKGGGI